MSQKYKRKVSNHDGDNSVRRAIKAHDLQPGCIVWLPASAIERRKVISQFKAPRTDNDQELPSKAYNHPVVVLKVMTVPSRNLNRDVFASVAMVRLLVIE